MRMAIPLQHEHVMTRQTHSRLRGEAKELNSCDALETLAGSRRVTIKTLVALPVLGVALGTSASANAKGCIKGAIVGGVAGHVAGHGAAGAAAGCVIGHHEANKHQNANQNR
jgi:outer membrane lipoprotein SlyB